jgi:hypothetical protein
LPTNTRQRTITASAGSVRTTRHWQPTKTLSAKVAIWGAPAPLLVVQMAVQLALLVSAQAATRAAL